MLTVDGFIAKKLPSVNFHIICFPIGHQVLTYSRQGEDESIIHSDSAPYLVIGPPVAAWNKQLGEYLSCVSQAFLAENAGIFIENMAQMVYRVACLAPFKRGNAAFSEGMLEAGLQSFNQRQKTIMLSVSVPPCSIAYLDQLALSAGSFEDFLEKFKTHFHVQQVTASAEVR